jgi:hypothetical protein
VVEVWIEIEAAERLDGAKTFASLDVFSKRFVYRSPFGMVPSEAFGFIE